MQVQDRTTCEEATGTAIAQPDPNSSEVSEGSAIEDGAAVRNPYHSVSAFLIPKRAAFKPPAFVHLRKDNPSSGAQASGKQPNAALGTSMHAQEGSRLEASVQISNDRVGRDDELNVKDRQYFEVLYCKYQPHKKGRKNKRYADGVLEFKEGKKACLYDEEGKAVGRSVVRGVDASSLGCGSELVVGSWEVEVDALLDKEKFDSGEVFLKISRISRGEKLTGAKHSTNGGSLRPVQPIKGIAAPALSSNSSFRKDSNIIRTVNTSGVANQSSLYDPYASEAVILNKKQWLNGSGKDSKGRLFAAVVLDPFLARSMRSHQIDGVKFMYECCSGIRSTAHLGCILADAMGLGKTLQALALIWTVLKQGPYGRPLVNKVLIVAPSSLCQNWALETRKWLGDARLRTLIISSGQQAGGQVLEFKHGATRVGIISYETLRQHSASLAGSIGLLIADEGHRLKSASGNKTINSLLALQCPRRILLTGTPVQNNLQEFFAMCDFCNPDVLGSSSVFNRIFGNPIARSRDRDATEAERKLGEARSAELAKRVQSFVLRRGSDINLKYLPPLSSYVVFCLPTKRQSELFSHELGSTSAKRLLEACGSDFGDRALCVLNNMRKIANHPVLYAEGEQENKENDPTKSHRLSDSSSFNPALSGKMTVLMNILDNIVGTDASSQTNHAAACNDRNETSGTFFGNTDQSKSDQSPRDVRTSPVASTRPTDVLNLDPRRRCVVVSQSTAVLDIIDSVCSRRGWKTLRLDGSTDVGRRQDLVNAFNRYGVGQIFLLSTTAGGAGLNLIGASRLVLYDSHWNPAMDAQAMARVWREGQRHECYVYRLITTGTLEEKIYQRQRAKGDVANTTMCLSENFGKHNDASSKGKKRSKKGQFSREELRQLFTFRTDTKCDTADVLATAGEIFEDCSGAGDVDNPLKSSIAGGSVSFVHLDRIAPDMNGNKYETTPSNEDNEEQRNVKQKNAQSLTLKEMVKRSDASKIDSNVMHTVMDGDIDSYPLDEPSQLEVDDDYS